MLSLSSQRNSFNVVISDIRRCKNSVLDVCDKLSALGFIYYLITHNKDVDNQGCLKRTHIHLVLSSMKRLRVKQLLNYLCDVFDTNVENIQVDEVVSMVACVQYLIHLNDVNKYQYSKEDVITNNESNLEAYLLEVPKVNELTTTQLLHYILELKLNKLELMEAIGIGKYQHYRHTINDIYDFRK